MLMIRICCLSILIPSLLATIYGLAVVLRKNRGLYFTIGVLAIICLMIGQLAYFITALTRNPQFLNFHIGTLGSIGCCLFLLTANMGPMNQLADDGSKKLKKYRLLALLGPAFNFAIFAFCLILMVQRNNYTGLASSLVMTLVAALPLYFSTKMSIIPDVDGGFVDCMRPFNYAVTVLCLLNTFEGCMRYLWLGRTVLEMSLAYALYGAIGICTLFVMAFLERGGRRWRNI